MDTSAEFAEQNNSLQTEPEKKVASGEALQIRAAALKHLMKCCSDRELILLLELDRRLSNGESPRL